MGLHVENIAIEVGILCVNIPAVLFANASPSLAKVKAIEPDNLPCHTTKLE